MFGFVLIRKRRKALTRKRRTACAGVACGAQAGVGAPGVQPVGPPAVRYRCATEEPSTLPSMMSRAYCAPIL
ncbi:hypothetical protein LMG24076_01327 [Trinickia soli]|nr:hypothetical protein LMG24076_01327 [Trinickia soli]